MLLDKCIEMAANEKKSFAINELTGQFVCITAKKNTVVIFDGDANNKELLAELLFDDEQILYTWNLVSDEKASGHIAKLFSKKQRDTSSNEKG